MNISGPAVIGREVTNVSFSFYTTEEIRRLSVKAISNPILMDTMNHPAKNGLYDPSLGPLDKHSICATCSLSYTACPGHLGHIELAMPVYNPILFNSLYQLIRSVCLNCHHFKMARHRVYKYVAIIKLIDAGLLVDAIELESTGLRVSKGKSGSDKKKKSVVSMEAADGDEQEEEEGAMDEESFTDAIDQFVHDAIQRAKELPPLDKKPTTHSHEYRRRLVGGFFKAVPTQKCQNCQCFNPAIRRDGNAKLFENALSGKYQRANAAHGVAIAPILEGSEKPKKAKKSQPDLIVSDQVQIKKKSSSKTEDYQMDDEIDQEDLAEEQQEEDAENDAASTSKKYLMPLEVREHLRLLWERERDLLDLFYGTMSPSGASSLRKKKRSSDYNSLFLDVLPVVPTRFRPASKMGDQQFEHPQNTHLTNILKTNLRLLEAKNPPKRKDGVTPVQDFDLQRVIQACIQLQVDVNCLVDSTQNKDASKSLPAGIKQVLEKKEGLFRKHMMGKRVNYAARSVISPDPYIETSEIGVPMVFAKKLTYPEPVTAYNAKLLRQAVINGPDKYPGASHIQHEDGSLSSLAAYDRDRRVALANQLLTPQSTSEDGKLSGANKKVLRHLRNGDVLLVNRQPTLHKPSMMAHVARVLPGERTIRMHYANCNTYNADFDGDEMNMHFPQNELARAELYLVANTDNQYVVPTDGKPIRGLIQDHVVTGVLMTMRGNFFSKEQYQQILFGSLPDSCHDIITVPPCIMKPKQLWSGKQLVTTVLLNLTKGLPQLNLVSPARIPVRAWDGGNPVMAEESTIVFCEGELVQGTIDKSQFGATAFGMVHAVYELYGAKTAGQLLTSLGRLFIKYIQFRGFTCRMDDLLLTAQGDRERVSLLEKVKPIGHAVSSEFVGLGPNGQAQAITQRIEPRLRDDREAARLDSAYKGKTGEFHSKIIDTCLPMGQLKGFRQNHMSLMIHTGAKGSNVNLSQISCLLGQQELEGRRVPRMVSGKTLPSFRPYETAAIAGGFIGSRFLTGIKPQEFYFHCMAGREGLVDTAVKTSRSGYLQRCLIKHLEGLRVSYDQTVRDSDGSVIQFHYGEDSLDVTKLKYMHKFEFSVQNYAAFLSKYKPHHALAVLEQEKGPKYARKARKNPEKYDPVLSRLNPALHLGAISESFEKELEKFLEKSEKSGFFEKINRFATSDADTLSARKFQALMWLRYVHSLVEPGEAVGLLAAQSIGEPSTQMTLNTFHFAGVGAKNVTLGIPRLREIIMTASAKIKTPFMELPLKPTATAQDANWLSVKLTRLTLDTVLQEVSVKQTIKPQIGNASRQRVYHIHFKFIPVEAYSNKYGLSKAHLKHFMGHVLTKRLLSVIKKELKLSAKHMADEIEEIGVGVSVSRFGDLSIRPAADENAPENDEGDAEPKAAKETEDSDEDEDEAEDKDEEDGETPQKEQASYEEQDEEEKAEQPANEEDDDEEENVAEEWHGVAKDEQEEQAADDDEHTDDDDGRQAKADDAMDKQQVLLINPHIVDYAFAQDGSSCDITLQYDLETRKLLMISLVEREAQRVILRDVKGIVRCFVEENENKEDKTIRLATEGVNFRGVWEYDQLIDVRSIQSNDIRAVLNTYGVEAARNTISKEIGKVFAVYGISVDPRHLTLVADHMTFEGGYRPFNRMGMESYPSPFQKMSFETTMHFLKSAALAGHSDNLTSPSSRIVLGKPVYGGTGSFDILQTLPVLS